MNIFVCLGKVAVGKGTRLEALKKKGVLNDRFVTISVGQVLRNAEKDNPELYEKIKESMEAGKLVSNKIVCELVFHKINSYQKMGKDVVLDGFPRNKKQAKALLENFKDDKIRMIVFNITDDEVIERTSHRLYCPVCGSTYTDNDLKPPKVEGVCDKCSGVLTRRDDDKQKVVEDRLLSYKKETKPAIDWLLKQPNVVSLFLPQPVTLADGTLKDPELEYFFNL